MSMNLKNKALASKTKKSTRKRQIRFGHYAVNVWLIFWAVVSVIPMLWLILAPSKTNRNLSYKNPLSFGNLTGYWHAWKNLQDFNSGVLARWAFNSITYT